MGAEPGAVQASPWPEPGGTGAVRASPCDPIRAEPRDAQASPAPDPGEPGGRTGASAVVRSDPSRAPVAGRSSRRLRAVSVRSECSECSECGKVPLSRPAGGRRWRLCRLGSSKDPSTGSVSARGGTFAASRTEHLHGNGAMRRHVWAFAATRRPLPRRMGFAVMHGLSPW